MKRYARSALSALACAAVAAQPALAAPAVYKLDPSHTFPSFEADHMGLSIWRGKLNRSRGVVLLDKEGGSGSVEVTMDLASIDFGHEGLNRWARGKEFFETAKYPTAVYRGRLEGFADGAPSSVSGELTLHGITRPVALQLDRFKCMPHPIFKRDWCGADALARFDREDFGLVAGKDWGFDMNVTLRIQVEAVADK